MWVVNIESAPQLQTHTICIAIATHKKKIKMHTGSKQRSLKANCAQRIYRFYPSESKDRLTP
jgi:hypothetical protein